MQHCVNYYALTVVILALGSISIGEARLRYAHAQPVALHLALWWRSRTGNEARLHYLCFHHLWLQFLAPSLLLHGYASELHCIRCAAQQCMRTQWE